MRCKQSLGRSMEVTQEVATHQQPLSGLKVLDLSSGPAGGLATMVLADFGACVIRYADSEYEYQNDMPSAKMWLRGKAAGRDLEGDLLDADIVVISRPNGFPKMTHAYCKARNPALIYCDISAFGDDSTVPVDEGVVAAIAGRMQTLQGIVPNVGPHYAAVPVATHATAQNAVAGMLAAVFQRLSSGRGQKVSTCMLQGLMSYDQGQSLLLQLNLETPVDPSALPSLNYHPVQCADGKWLQLGNLLPHLLKNFMRVIGLEELFSELPENLETVRYRILETMQTKTCAQWMALFIADGDVAAHPYQSANDALKDPDMILNYHVVELNGIKQLGPLARLTRTPAKITTAAKSAGGFNWTPAVTATNDPALPLKGVVVLELASIIAAPLGTSYLAEMGARVIKVEPIGGEPYRNMLGGIGAVRCNQNKESICVDLKSAEGQQIVRRLASQADILIHNYRPGVPERLGFGYEAIEGINPQIIYLSANGYGTKGPSALRPSTHPIPGAAMGGALYQAGEIEHKLLDIAAVCATAKRLMAANELNPDPNTALVICASILLGLLGRESTGTGQQIFVDMFVANAYANFDDMIWYPKKADRPGLGEQLKGPYPLYRLYPAQTGWVFLGLKAAKEWRAFCALVDPSLASIEQPFNAENTNLASALTKLFATKPAVEWEMLLSANGIACVQADKHTLAEFFHSQCHNESKWMTKVSHDELGDYYRHKSIIDFEYGRTSLKAGVRAGVDGQQLLSDLGYKCDEIETLFTKNLLWSVDRA